MCKLTFYWYKMIINLTSPPHLEYVARTDVQAFHGQIYQSINWQWHLYEHPEKVIIGGQEFLISPGDVTLIPPGLRSEYLGSRVGHRYRVLHFRLEDTEETRDTALHLPIHFSLSRDGNQELARLHKQMVDTKVLKSQQNRSCLWHFLWRLKILSLDKPETLGNGVRELAKTISEIQSTKHMPIRISELVANSMYSQSHLNRLCRERYGVSLKAYLQRSRMDQAKSILLYSDDSVSSIAQAVGIPDLQHFNKTFHSHFGCSPRKWRAENNTRDKSGAR